MRSPITQLVQDFQGLSVDQQAVFLDLVDPQPEPETPKRTRAKKTGAKSKRASGMAAAIRDSIEAQQAAAIARSDSEANETGPMCGTCGHGADYMDHSGPSPTFHAFEAPKVKKATSQNKI